MIISFKGKKPERFFYGESVKDYRGFAKQLSRRLIVLDSAESVRDLSELRSNRFETLTGDRKGQLSIRINRQWRICFRWGDEGPEDVEIVDYH
jgi:proteic killer suppression protein